jgi:hypothetical protein
MTADLHSSVGFNLKVLRKVKKIELILKLILKKVIF